MTHRLTDDQLGWFDRYIRPGYDEMASGDDMLALVAEVREHRATIERVRKEATLLAEAQETLMRFAGRTVLKALDTDQ